MASIQKILKYNFLWIIYFIFVAATIISHEGEHPFISKSPVPAGKYLLWVLYLAFLAYSIYCARVERFFGTLKKLYPFKWARQIGLDLYLGLIISLGLMCLNEGTILVGIIWLVPVLIYANLAILLYMALNYDGIVSHFF